MPKRSLSALGKQKRTNSICTCLQIRKAARSVTQFYDRHIQQAGMTPAQHSLLMIVYFSGDVTPSRLAEIAVLDRTTLTRNLKLLEKQQLVTSVPGQKDRRTRIIQITPSGIDKLREIMPMWEQAQQQILKKLGDESYDTLMTSLEEVVERMKE